MPVGRGDAVFCQPNYTLELDKDACVQCGACIERCPMFVISFGDDCYPQMGPECAICYTEVLDRARRTYANGMAGANEAAVREEPPASRNPTGPRPQTPCKQPGGLGAPGSGLFAKHRPK